MAEPSRGLQISRRGWLLAGLTAPLSLAWADSLTVTFDGDNLHVSSPDLHFLTGKPLARLQEGSTVVYVTSITLYRDQWISQFRRAEARFVVSYDVLGDGDKFAVTMPGPPPRKALNLSKTATETWCLESLWIAAAGMAADRQFWLQLDVHAGSQRDLSSVLGDKGISVDLIDALSKIPGTDLPMTRRAGPFRLADLARTPGRGPNG